MNDNYNKNNAALAPPMGWNSWDCFAAAVTEEQLFENARAMQRHLLKYGWEYIVCDIQWSEPLSGTGEREYRPFAKLCLDGYSRQIPAPNRFPSSKGGRGFKPIADEIHSMGLKFGLHIMRGIPRQAAHGGLKTKGGFLASDIADPFSISRWNSDMYGVDASKPGAQEYYNSLFELYAAWGVDFIKVDDICNTNMYPHNPYSAKAEIELISRAIKSCGRPMVLSLSPGPAVIDEAWHLKQNANMWRITDDFWDDWVLLKEMFRRCEVWESVSLPGCWPDCDMLPLGLIGAGFKKPRRTNFTHDEQVTMMALWSIFRSPLIMGGELTELDSFTLSLLTDKTYIDANQKGRNPRQIMLDNDCAVWSSDGEGDSTYIALFNLSDSEREVCHEKISAKLAPHGAKMFQLDKWGEVM
jgi:hypothetical protein